jgi:D-alanine-D-alanine ligase|tara:strand:+ start:452 stop:1411 length:960 start_codon:yes stop_codon:yes gene_type:complete
MKNIAIITGGDSEEYSISLNSAETVYKHLDRTKYNPFIIEIKNNIWRIKINSKFQKFDQINFCAKIENRLVEFYDVFMSIHGPPAENGELQKYLDDKKIYYTCCNSNISELTFDKFKCNQIIKDLGYNIAKSYIHIKNNSICTDEIISNLKLPIFVKPNQAGSSNGISMVKEKNGLKTAINKAFKHDDKVIIEEYIDGVEVSCGVLTINNKIITLPITEIISENDFFDYDAKYNNKSQEITPARITNKETNSIQKITKEIYEKLKLKGLCRIDFIIKIGKPYIIEINTIPGLSEQSIIPKQIKQAGYSLKEVFTICLEN